MQSVIWDWNGTLLNDLELCISSINQLLGKRGLALLDHNRYKEVFSFPVKDYYEAIGFDFSREDFSVPAHEFIDLYENGVKNCLLQNHSMAVLDFFKTAGRRQFVLSAMHQGMLEQTLRQQQISRYFEGVVGLDDHYAVSKVDRGRQLISKFKIYKNKAVMIGDTIHDFEVSEELGISCILVANGHQSASRLKNTGVTVVESLEELLSEKILEK